MKVTLIINPRSGHHRAPEAVGLAVEQCSRLDIDLTVHTIHGPGHGTELAREAVRNGADRVLCARNAWLAPLPPEGAAAILWRDASRADEMAAALGMTATDLLAEGIIDAIIPEHDDAAEEPIAFCRRTGAAIEQAIRELVAMGDDERLAGRIARYR